LETMFEKYTRKDEKKWPWWLQPIAPYSGGRKLVKCSCGRVMWLDSPQIIRNHHLGHRIGICERSSMLDFIKMKLNLLDRRTVGECWQDFLEGLKKCDL
jgi:hypothetical protein